jgi:uncharacterized protein YbjT (DUF2867 family)
MKIIVFGATGGTGKLIVSQALAKGHSVTAFVRNPEGLTQDPHLRVIQGDKAIPHILEAMRQEYVTRLIVLGASGVVRDHGKYQNALTNMALWVAKKTALKHPFIDQAAQERLLAASDVDYTIVRAPRLLDGPFTGTYRILPDALPPGALRITRADVADFMLQQLTDPRFHRQGPYIGSGKV